MARLTINKDGTLVLTALGTRLVVQRGDYELEYVTGDEAYVQVSGVITVTDVDHTFAALRHFSVRVYPDGEVKVLR